MWGKGKTMTRPLVMVIERDEAIRQSILRSLKDDFDLLPLEGTEAVIPSLDPISAIVVCCLRFKGLDLPTFVASVTPHFRGPVIAISKHHRQLLRAGCHTSCTNWELPAELKLCLGMRLTPAAVQN